MKDIAHFVERLYALVQFIDRYPLSPEVREGMTYRQIQDVFLAKQRELGLDIESWEEEIRENDQIGYWLEQLGMAMDERELVTEEHHMDLPLNFNWMAEYEPMLAAEEAFWEKQKVGPVDTAPLFDIVREYAPKRKIGPPH
jgi:hypothetical protein